MSTPCGPKRHVYWVNSGGPGVARNTKCVRGYCERVTAQWIFSSSYFQDKVDNLLENYYAALESESCMDRSDVLMWRNMSPIQCQPPDTDHWPPRALLSPLWSGVCLFCKPGTHQQLYFRKLQPLPVHVSRKWESFSLNFDLLTWAISLFPQQLAICVIINKGCRPLTSYLPSLNNNFSKIGHVNHTLNCGPDSFLSYIKIKSEL